MGRVYILGNSYPGGYEEIRRTSSKREAESWVSSPSCEPDCMRVYSVKKPKPRTANVSPNEAEPPAGGKQ